MPIGVRLSSRPLPQTAAPARRLLGVELRHLPALASRRFAPLLFLEHRVGQTHERIVSPFLEPIAPVNPLRHPCRRTSPAALAQGLMACDLCRIRRLHAPPCRMPPGPRREWEPGSMPSGFSLLDRPATTVYPVNDECASIGAVAAPPTATGPESLTVGCSATRFRAARAYSGYPLGARTGPIHAPDRCYWS